MLIPTRALIPVIWNARQDLEELEAGRVPADGAGVGRRSRFTSWLSPARKHPSDILLHDSSCTRDKVLTLFHTHRPVQGNNVETRVLSLSSRGEKRRGREDGRGWKMELYRFFELLRYWLEMIAWWEIGGGDGTYGTYGSLCWEKFELDDWIFRVRTLFVLCEMLNV